MSPITRAIYFTRYTIHTLRYIITVSRGDHTRARNVSNAFPPTPAPHFVVRTMLACMAFGPEEKALAADFFERQTRLPHCPAHHYRWLIHVYTAMNLPEEALDTYARSELGTSGLDYRAAYACAYAHACLDNFEQAADFFRHALHHKPDYAIAEYGLAFALFKLDEDGLRAEWTHHLKRAKALGYDGGEV
jgi:tetratricopeptide (TPR) repeat protein